MLRKTAVSKVKGIVRMEERWKIQIGSEAYDEFGLGTSLSERDQAKSFHYLSSMYIR